MKIKILVFCVLIFATTASIYAQFKIQENVFSCGGTNSLNTNFILKGTTGEQFASLMMSSSYILHQGFWNSVTITTEVEEENELPEKFQLFQNYPNPFNPTTTIKYELPEEVSVTLKVYNILGQEVKTLINSFQQAGRYELEFDAGHLASGTYFLRLETDHYTGVKKMLILK